MDDYFDRIDAEELPDDGWNSDYWGDDCLPLEDDPAVTEPEFPVHSYGDNCEACWGRCYYANQIPQGFCEYHGHFDLTDEDGNCPECLAIACDWQAGAYVDNDPITCWE